MLTFLDSGPALHIIVAAAFMILVGELRRWIWR
jgi:hypothetical protein